MPQTTLFPEKPLNSRDELNALVDKAADIIRTATDYKFILVLLLLKRMSDVWKDEFEEKKKELLERCWEREKAEKEAENEVYHIYNLRRELLWDNVTKDVKKLPENLTNALKEIAELNPELRGILDRFNFLAFTSQEHREKLRMLVELFNKYNLGKHVSSDIIGDAYEHILYRFAPSQAKQGEVYTPREVIRLLVKILDPKPDESVYDPACGSSGMLIESFKHVKEVYKAEDIYLYGQEYNQDIYAICKMNLLAHGITDAVIEFGDSLLYPRFKENGKLKQFDVVIANPPWNQDGYGEETLKRAEFRERYLFGYSPNNSADWAWIQHMIASAKDDTGRVGIVIDNGALFRGGKEKIIREKILRRDLVECVILLPEKLFYNTGAPGAIIILRKKKPEERKGKVLFINASNEYEKHPEVRKLNRLGDKHIEKIADAYKKFEDIDGFCRVVSLEEIKENDYNLNVTLYVFPREELEKINIAKEWEELRRIEVEIKEVDGRIEGYLEELRYDISKG